MSLLTPRRRLKPIINIVPLVDVLIVLIFFFLMTMHFKNLNVLNITPPKVETAGKNEAPENIIIGLDSDGTFYFNNETLSRDELRQALTLAAQLDKRQSVLVIADEDSLLKNMTTVMDASRQAGLEKVRLQVR